MILTRPRLPRVSAVLLFVCVGLGALRGALYPVGFKVLRGVGALLATIQVLGLLEGQQVGLLLLQLLLELLGLALLLQLPPLILLSTGRVRLNHSPS